MDQIRHYADISIRRACGFGFLAIATTMVGASSELVLSLKIGATSVTLMSIILVLKAMQAPARSYKRTEVWILLNHRHNLPEKRAQEVFGTILRERYLWHATIAAGLAAVLWVLTFSIRLLGPTTGI
jgi:predicted RND superfamily exporter protein